MAAADRLAGDAGVPAEELMESAGKAVARELVARFPDAKRALVMCGKGNNGGDGFVAALDLARRLNVTVLETGGEPRSNAAAGARADLTSGGHEPGELTAAAVRTWLADARPEEAVIVDAILGSGLQRALEGELADVVRAVNDCAVPVVAVDVPTGVNADRAVPPGDHIRADITVQLAGAKVASAFHPARRAFLGARPGDPTKVIVADIGIPQRVLEEASQTLYLEPQGLVGWLPLRDATAHKYTVGTVTVVAGSRRYLGAAELVCRGAWRAGAGLVTLVAEERYPVAWPETVLAPPSEEGGWPPDGLSEKAAGALVIGPGLDTGSQPSLARTVAEAVAWAPGPVLLDAGALDPEVVAAALEAAVQPVVLTPHHGEAGRLLASYGDEADLKADPLGAARALTGRTGAITVLKGATTVIVSPDGREAVSDRGHPGLASGGTGDVLAGVKGALLAAPDGDPFERACLAVHVHGRAGELAGEAKGMALIASDVIEAVPRVLLTLAET